MSNPRARGCLLFVAIVAVVVVVCGLIPFVILPSAGLAMALPVIAVPGEVVTEGGLFGIDLTNTLIGTFLASFVVVVIALLAYRASRGWTKEVPGRFQGLIEVIAEGLYGFLKGLGGDRLRTTPFLWPLVATIFLFLLTANLLKLFPGVETIGKVHCAHVGLAGYPVIPSGGATLLYVNAPLDGGTPQSEESEHACHEYFVGHYTRYAPSSTEPEAIIADLEAQRATLATELAAADDEAAVDLEEELAILDERIESAITIEELTPEIAALEARIAELKAAPADGHGAADDHAEESAVVEPQATATAVAAEGEVGAEIEGEETVAEEVAEETGDENTVQTVEGVVEDSTEDELANAEEELAAARTALNLAHSQLQYPHATLPLTPEDLEKGAVPYIFHITPFVRGAATDLSLTIAYALMTVIIVQVYGVWALGPAYFEKFINLSALGNLGKKPLGAIDFIVGLFEIISEIGKIVSLAFRLFGNLFAGGVALIAISFLISLLLPGVIYLLELVIGAVQALVFSVLTLVFVVQAMEHHGGDDHHDDAHSAEAGHH